ncbi:hypothetical protein TVAG_083860 [Trichomonas vaginalis G3]|uniref:CID domain-containing protein n=1 Tax=Trichomonas vaginalis (strain ATCC PRA-98 / G3) TaxID=412133 RepID=A2DMB0_TRIV3|nr:hypothetical protein TVAGG3_0983440 [Trichomonas vaginalis G3]EAY18530.1 hypothetical protein TVAG_083860 [Trichomonas vaginalis G3]KAI5489480.1 hypothetical protein TVAGG3_0983440 [Trichomonas vaginalis G3]|eukprot:XP_001579516.1 hypothetical protein [Trichomonas vaginalis G3]
MNAEQLEDIFIEKISNIEILDENEADTLSWFLDDYKRVAGNFIAQIFYRIVSPQQAKNNYHEIPIINLFLILDVMISKCDPIYLKKVSIVIKECVQSAIPRMDPQTFNKLREYIDVWANNNTFTPEITEELQNLFKTQNRKSHQVIMATPLQLNFPEKKAEETPVSEPKYARGWMKTLDQWLVSPQDLSLIPLNQE